jgi:subtilase family protein/fervidolysin-like protein
MGSGEDRARTASKSSKVVSSNKVSRPKLLLSAALAALIVAAPASDQASAQMMSLGPNFGGGRAITGGGPVTGGGNLGGVRVNGGPQSFVPLGPVGHTAIGAVGIVGRGDPGRGISGDPCDLRRGKSSRCGTGKGNVVVITGGGDRPGGGDDNPRHPHEPIWPHRPHWINPPDPIVAVNPPIVVTQPTVPGGGSAPQASRRSGTGVPPANERRYVPDEVVVELAASTTNTDALARRHRLTRLQSVTFPLGGTTLVRWRIADRRSVPVVIRALETDATVLSAQPNYLFALQDQTATPAAPSEGDPAQYMLDKMHLPQAHELAKGNKVLVAVIDSGVDVTHPDLAGDIAGTFDALGTGLKAHAHGTAIAGAIAAHGRLMGAAPAAQILAVRAFSGDGADDGTTFAIMSGLSWAVSYGARVVNMSFAGPQDPGIARSLAAAHEKGVVLVAAAGNRGAKSPPLFPAADPNVIAVTATDASDQLPAFANRGRYVAVAAPGVDLMLLAPNGTLQFSSGTSFAAAYVTGTAALMLERRPDLAPDTLRQALAGTAHHLGSKGTDKAADDQSGAGLVDAYQAVLSLLPAPVDAANVTPAAVRR